jgi:predicted transcriptional regulator
MYRVYIKAEPHGLGADPSYRVAVMKPGQSIAPTAIIKEHTLQVALHEILSTTSAAAVRQYLSKARTPEGGLIKLQHLSEQHFDMLRGLPPAVVGSRFSAEMLEAYGIDTLSADGIPATVILKRRD